MPEEVLFKSESRQDRHDIAEHLRAVAEKLDGDGALTLSGGGGDSLTMQVPASATFEVKAERETGSGPDELSVEFELEWNEGEEGAGTDAGLSIE
ncbi:amphi-Trp domain-containing protein [Halobaculum marinum]|uniref:Amphi-Trp domain-containing protein n=1 Tax=Halobaculum marinum TaxID=3031996 RepID=A0ABD5WZJ8_9EURY|nr:amphi-Trp domain-containing protein [Halobaculum sp. DT55]